jgi:hypothetical protein
MTSQVIWARTREVVCLGDDMVTFHGWFLDVRSILNFFRDIGRIKVMGYGDAIEAVW